METEREDIVFTASRFGSTKHEIRMTKEIRSLKHEGRLFGFRA